MPTLEELIASEKAAYKVFTDAFIQHTMARNALNARLAEIGQDHPSIFTEDKDT